MSRAGRFSAAAVVAACLGGCGAELPSPVLVNKLRLLDLVADPAEITADGTMTVRAVWADGSTRAGRPVFFLWRLCATTAEYDPRFCLLRDRGTDLATGQGLDTMTLHAAELPSAPVIGSPPARRYVLLLAMCPDAAPEFDAPTGQYQCPSEREIPYEQREGIQGFRHVMVRASTPPPLNTAPAIARVNVSGMDPSTLSTPITVPSCARGSDGLPTCGGVPLVIFPAPNSAESYSSTDGGTQVEALLASFFATGGSTNAPRALPSATDPNAQDGSLRVTWYPPEAAGDVKLWFTLRDGRGGDTALGPVVVTVR